MVFEGNGFDLVIYFSGAAVILRGTLFEAPA